MIIPLRWARDAVFYQIFPDRFAASDRVPKPGPMEPWEAPPTVHGYKGGDLLGVAEHLDELGDLGVTALYLTPVLTSASNHRYHTDDYYSVDPLLGGNEALARAARQAHARNMRVVLDGVFNHCGRGFWRFHHVAEAGQRALLDPVSTSTRSASRPVDRWSCTRATSRRQRSRSATRAWVPGGVRRAPGLRGLVGPAGPAQAQRAQRPDPRVLARCGRALATVRHRRLAARCRRRRSAAATGRSSAARCRAVRPDAYLVAETGSPSRNGSRVAISTRS